MKGSRRGMKPTNVELSYLLVDFIFLPWIFGTFNYYIIMAWTTWKGLRIVVGHVQVIVGYILRESQNLDHMLLQTQVPKQVDGTEINYRYQILIIVPILLSYIYKNFEYVKF